ncbi:MAG: poly[(R)-3-hydroxyalkanoate] polymerase subunit PhaC [Pseudonocardiales bacterium]|nr:poly[(R)-3-hydroxyalkanoate] polymerase subunit PhaC [Pseudonocardiales bacterium]
MARRNSSERHNTDDNNDHSEVGGGEPVGLPSATQAIESLAAVLSRGGAVSQELIGLATELGRVLIGTSTLAPAERDRRFTDPAWSRNPLFRRLVQAYLAAAGSLGALVDDLDAHVEDHRLAERARFAANILAAAAAPTNMLVTNPAGLKRAFDTGGASLLSGLRNLVDDLRHNGGMPATVEPGVFQVGRDLALTPGAVVAREPLAELIQYTPTTETVHERPILVVPPPIGRYYFLDLRPGRSFVEFAVANQLNTFLLSWRNPGPAQGSWDLEDYASTVLTAIDHVRAITGSPEVNLIGFCAGGIISSTVLSHLAATGDPRVHSASFAVTLLDFGQRAPLTAYNDRTLLDLVGRRSKRAGVITSRQLGAAFTWMRPDDLVFSYVVNNYVLGERPPTFDILAWNADGTNLPAALHNTFLDIFQNNNLVEPGGLSALGTPVDLSRITVPTFVTGAVSDHLTPWKSCYRTTQLVGGDTTFVLSYSGHIASLINPPGNPKAHYWQGGPSGADPDAWLEQATRTQGSWWEPWARWAKERSGSLIPAPDAPGDAEHPALDPAPGRYVTAEATS